MGAGNPSSQVKYHRSWSRRRRLLWSGTCRRARRSSGRADVAAEHGEDGLAEVNLRLRDLASPSPAVMGSHSAAAAPQTTAVESRVESRGASTRSSTCAIVGDGEALPRQGRTHSQDADQHEHSTPHPATPGNDHQPRPLDHERQPRTSRNHRRPTEAHRLQYRPPIPSNWRTRTSVPPRLSSTHSGA